MSSRTDPMLTIDRAMTAEERALFLANFTRINRHWLGAQVADVLDHLCNSDASLDVVEPFFEAHEHEVSDKHLLGPAIRAVLWTHGASGLTWERVRALLGRGAAVAL